MNWQDLLPFQLTAVDAIAVLAGFATFVAAASIWLGLIARDPYAARVRALSQRREQLKREMLGATTPTRRKREGGMHTVRALVKKFKLVQGEHGKKIASQLAQAGLRGRDGVVLFVFMKASLPLAFGALGAFSFYVTDLLSLSNQGKLIASLACVALGYFAPNIYIKNLGDKRKHALRLGLPDGLDLLVICTEAGLALDAALDRVGREIAGSAPELSDELALTALELRFLPERRKALENLQDRTDMQQIQGLINTLIQTEKYGTPLAAALRVLGNEMRQERLMRAEEKAARLPAVLTVPMVLFILPSLFVVLIGPGIIKVIDGFRSL